MKNKGKWISGFIVVFFVALFGYILYDSTPKASEGTQQNTGLVEFSGAFLEEKKDGKPIWKLAAKKIMMDPVKKKVYLTDFNGVFIDEKGTELTLTAPEGVADQNTKQIILKGEIIGKSSDGTVLKAVNLQFDGMKNIVTATDGFTITKNDTVITGNKLNADVALELITATGNAKISRGGK